MVGWAERVAAVGDEIMVVATDPPEIEHAGLTICCDRDDVVSFEAFGAVTTHDDTCRVAIYERGLEFGGDFASVVADGADIDAVRDQYLEECATEEIFACMIDRDRPDPRNLTPFTMLHFATQQRLIIDDHNKIHIRVRLRRTRRRGARRCRARRCWAR